MIKKINDDDFKIIEDAVVSGETDPDLMKLFVEGNKERILEDQIRNCEIRIQTIKHMRDFIPKRDLKRNMEEELKLWKERLDLEKENYKQSICDDFERINSVRKTKDINEIIRKLEKELKIQGRSGED